VLNERLERWMHSLKSRRFRLSGSKTEYLRCGFGGEERAGVEVTMSGMVISRVKKFKYLGSIINEGGDIDEDIDHRFNVGWQK